jgi:beta-lactamase superfamily II metal-dependent hydrolase
MSLFKTFRADSAAPGLITGDANLGELNFAFVDMGQGDCILISDPKNNVYVVDCGSIDRMPAKSMADAQDMLRKWAGNNKIELILTHPDRDHYNKFYDLLTGKEPKVLVKNIYFSQSKSDASPLGNYTQGYFNSCMNIFGNPDLVEVTINSSLDQIKTWQQSDNYQSCTTEALFTETVELANGTVGGQAWSIKIIAGNVESEYTSEADISNTASLVTLAQLGTRKLLLTGDSTTETFDYLADFHANDIKDVEMFQIPHHGSESSLPSPSFVDTVNPKALIISVGLLNTSFFLPKGTIIEAWLKSKALRSRKFVIDYWVYGNNYYNSYQRLQEILNVAWKGLKYESTTTNTFYWLLDPEDANGRTGFYGFSNKNYFLYRVETNKDLWITGVEGSLFDEDWK